MALYRLSVKMGNAGAGRSHFDYIAREGKYKKGKDNELKEDLVCCHTFNLPKAFKNPRDFWKAEEKAKDGFRKIEVALPKELNAQQQKEALEFFLKKEFGSNYVYSYAIHHSKGSLSGEENPHAHIMFSERKIDKNREEPDKENWFKRGGKKKDGTISGGYRKDRKFSKQTGSKWINEIRDSWEQVQNTALRLAGSKERVSAKSLKAQGVDRMPQKHLGEKRCRMQEDTPAKTDYQEIKAFQHHENDIQDIYRAYFDVVHMQKELDRLKKAQKREQEEERARMYHQEQENAKKGQNSQNLEGSDTPPAPEKSSPPKIVVLTYEQRQQQRTLEKVLKAYPKEYAQHRELVDKAIQAGVSHTRIGIALERETSDKVKKTMERYIKGAENERGGLSR